MEPIASRRHGNSTRHRFDGGSPEQEVRSACERHSATNGQALAMVNKRCLSQDAERIRPCLQKWLRQSNEN